MRERESPKVLLVVLLLFTLLGSTLVSLSVPVFASSSISLSPSSGVVGATVTVTGTGLIASHAVNATYASWVRACPPGSSGSCDVISLKYLPLALSGSCTTSSTGSLGGCTFTVPSVPYSLAEHTVIVSDGTNTLNATFTVLTPSISLSPSFGAVGTSVAIIGSGFIASHGLTVTYDGSAAGMPTTCTTDALGNTSAGCTFTVPSSSALGNHTITVSDGTNSPTATFTVTLLRVSCSKSPVVVGSTPTCKATVHESGVKAPTGTVAWSSGGSGAFSRTSCVLSKHKTYSTCSVKYTPTGAGSVMLTANYSGDSNNPATAGAYNLIVTTKATKTTVSCTPRSVAAGSSILMTCKVKVAGYSPTGTVSWAESGSGSVFFNSTTCILASVNPHQGACSVVTMGATAGKVILQATYSGDPNNQGSSRTTTLAIKKPSTAPTTSCSNGQTNPTGPVPTDGSWQRKIVNASGLIWEFYTDGTNIVYRTSPNASTWSSSTVVIPSATRAWWFTVYQNGSSSDRIWFAFAETASGDSVFEYGNGTLNANGTISWIQPFMSGSTIGSTPNYPSLTFDSGGHMWLALETYGFDGTRHIEAYMLLNSSWENVFDLGGLQPWPEPILTPLSNGGMALSILSAAGQLSVYTTSDGGASWTGPVTAPSRYEDFSAVAVGNTVHYAAATFGGSVQGWNYTLSRGMGAPVQLSPSGYQACGATISTDGKSSLAVAFSDSNAVILRTSTDLGSAWTAPVALSIGDLGIAPLSLTSDYFITGSVLVMWSDVSPSLGTYQVSTAIAPFP